MSDNLNLSNEFAAQEKNQKELARKLFMPYKSKTGNLIIRTPHLSKETMDTLLDLFEDLRWVQPVHYQIQDDVIVVASDLVFLMMDMELMVCTREQRAQIKALLTKKTDILPIRILAPEA